MYNKKVLSTAKKELNKAKAPKKPKDMITDPMGQWKYPGLPTRIPSNDITMKGVGYPVLGVANNGQRKIMLPGADYTFPGADYVDEYPQMRKGGAKKKKTKSLSGTNKIMLTHPLLQNYKNKVYDPNVDYFQDGGEKDTIIYPPGDSEYMDQPSYNYDIIEMLNQKARRGYEEYMHDQTDPTNINRTSPAYQQKFHMREGLIQAQKGGTSKSKNGTITNVIENPDGSKTVQVKTKDGKYFEKVIPNNKYISPLTGKPYVPMQGDATIPSGWEAEDNTLEDISEFIDPTGITSWDDVRRAYDENGLFHPQTALEILGALPLIGKIGKSGKILAGGEKLFLDAVKYFGYNDKIANAYKAYIKMGGKNLDKVLGLTTKGLTELSPKLNPEKWESSMKLINALNKFTEGAKATKLLPYLPSGDTQTKNDEDYIEAELTDDEIEEYRKGGYIVEDISVPELTQAQKGHITTTKSKDGTVTNKFTNANGDTVIQVKDKNGKFSEKIIPNIKADLKIPKNMAEAQQMMDRGELDYESYSETKARNKKEAEERKQERVKSLSDYEKRVSNPKYNSFTGLPGEDWRENLANEASSLGAKFRVSQEDNFFDDYLNPLAMIGSGAQSLGEAPKLAKETNSYMPYVTAIGTPLVTGALASVGANNTKQFVNNLVNPLAGTKNIFSKTSKPAKSVLSDYRNIEELRHAYNGSGYKEGSHIFSSKEHYDKAAKEAKDLYKKYNKEFEKKYGPGRKEEVLIYGAHKELKNHPERNFLTNEDFSNLIGVNSNLTNQEKFLSDAYQLEFSELFNKTPSSGFNPKFAEEMSQEMGNVVGKNKINRPVQVKRASNFNREVRTKRGGSDDFSMVHYNDLKEGDIIYPDHLWSTTSDVGNPVWGSDTNPVARINLPSEQKVLRPNTYTNSQYPNEQEIILPKEAGYKVSTVNQGSKGDDIPRFIFDAGYRKGGYASELNQAQKGIISTKEYTDKKGNKTIKVIKEDGTVHTKVIGKDGNVFNKTFDPKKDSWLTDQTRNLYSKPQGAGNYADEFFTEAALLPGTVKGVKAAAPLVKQGFKTMMTAAPSWAPGANLGNFLTAAGGVMGVNDYIDPNSDVRKATKKAYKKPTADNVAKALYENTLNALNFSGFGTGNKVKDAYKYVDDVADKVAHGETIIPYAWKSRAQGMTAEQAQEIYNAIKNKKPLTEWQQALVRNYAFDSNPYTGRRAPIDQVLKDKLNNLIRKTGVNMSEDAVLTRRLDSQDPKLFPIEKKVVNFGDRPVSFSAGIGAEYNGPKDRIVLSGRNARKASKNFLKNENFVDYSDDVLEKIPEDKRQGYLSLPKTILQERELIGTDLNLKQLGKVKNELGGFDYIMKPKGRFFESGGQVELELSDDEIQDYINQGYIVEEIDQPDMQSGGQLPYKIWEEKTGTPWSEAKRQGLTDGSYEQNIALAQKLLADTSTAIKENLESKPSFDYNKYDQIVSTLVQKGDSLEDLVAKQIGTKEGLMKRYPSLFNNANAKAKVISEPVKSVDEILNRKATPINLKTPTSRIKSETLQYQNIPVKKLNLISDTNLKPKKVNDTVKQFVKSKKINEDKLREADLKNYVATIRDSLTPDTVKKQKQLQNSFFPTAPKKKLTVKEPLTQESAQEFKARMLKIQQGLNLKPIQTNPEKVTPIKNFQDLQGEPSKYNSTVNLPEINGKELPIKKPIVKAKPPQNIPKFQNTLKPEFEFKKGTKLVKAQPETEENEVVKEDSEYKVISNLTNRVGSYDQSLQNLYYDYTNPKHSPEKRKQVKAAFDNKLKERNNLITTINSKKRDYAGVLDSWIDESAPGWIKKPVQKMDLSDQVEASSYKLPKFETYKEKEEKENEKFRTSKRFDDLGGDEKGSRWQFRVAASNDDPMKVQLYGTRSERNPNLNIKSKGAVMHFLDQSPLTGYMHPITKDYYNNLKPDGFVGKLEKQKDGNYAVKYIPKKDIPAKDLHKNTFLVRQEKFDNIDFNKKVADDNFPGHTYWTKKGSTKATIPVSSGKDANVYDYSSGQSVVFIFPYKGKTRYVHFAGSPNAIKKEGEEIKKLYKLQANKLVLGVADAGSYSSSVKGNITDKKLKDWNYGYANRNGFTGAGMALVD